MEQEQAMKNTGRMRTGRLRSFSAIAALSLFLAPGAFALAAPTSVTVASGTNFAVAVAPDGHALAIDLQGLLWIVPKNGGAAKPISDRLGDVRLPVWSPDGKTLAFQSYRDGNWHVWTVREDGSALTQWTTGTSDNREPSWARDGKSLYFASDRAGNYDIWRVDLGSRALTRVTTEPSEDYSPAIAANGGLAYLSRSGGAKRSLDIKRLKDGAPPTVVYSAARGTMMAGLSWLPDGRLSVVAYDNVWTADYTTLLAIDAASGQATPLTGADEDVFPFRASRDNAGAVYYAADGRIKRRDPKAGVQDIRFAATLTFDNPAYTRKRYDFFDQSPRRAKGLLNPVLAPDGQAVAVAALGDLWLLPRQGQPRQITRDPFVDIDPAFSPDGRRLVFITDRSGAMELWLHDLASGSEQRLTATDAVASAPAWSPDGTEIAYLMTGAKGGLGGGSLMVLSLASGATRTIATFHDGVSRPSWSPDGRFLAVSTLRPASGLYREGGNYIRVIEVASGAAHAIEPTDGHLLDARDYTGPVWSPDGRHIASVMDKGLWLFPVDGQGRATAAPRLLVPGVTGGLSWNARGTELLFQSADTLRTVAVDSGKIDDFPVTLRWSPNIGDNRIRLQAGRVFDGMESGYRRDLDILIDGNRIVDMVPRGSRPDFSGRVIDARDKTVMPGLIESHAHVSALNGERMGRLWLSYGITAIREPATDPYDALENREAVMSGVRPGPRIFFTGRPIDGSRIYYPLMNPTATAAELDEAMKTAAALDYDLIKTYVRLPNALQSRVAAMARELGLPVATHELYPAAAYGVASKEHLKGTSRDGFGSGLSLRSRLYDDVPAILAAGHMNLTPTISLLAGLALLDRENPQYFTLPQYLAFTSEAERTDLRESFLKGYFGRKSTDSLRTTMTSVRQSLAAIRRAGGRITAGTDCPLVPCGISLHGELSLSAGADGLSNHEALMSATAWAADAIGAGDQMGRLRPGMVADIAIIDGDPLTRIGDTLKVQSVIANGRYFTVKDLIKPPRTE